MYLIFQYERTIMKTKNLLKIANISGWLLVTMLVLYFISGYAMVHKYGMNALMSKSQAWFWHSYLTIPFIILLFAHITPYFIVRKQVKKCLIFIGIVIALPMMSVYAIDKLQKPAITTPDKKEQTENKSVKCKNCPKECLIKPGETGECGKFKNANGKIQPVEKTK